MRFGSVTCAAASGVGRGRRPELRVEKQQGTGLATVIHSPTQLAHMLSTGGQGTSAQVLHRQPGKNLPSVLRRPLPTDAAWRCPGDSFPHFPQAEGQILQSDLDRRS